MAEAQEQQLRLDLEELTRLRALAKRPLPNVGPAPAPAPTPTVVASPSTAASALNYVTLGSFSWDQDNDKLKNYRCAIAKLNKEIDPGKCRAVVKPSRVIITLQKASKGNWLDLHFKEDKNMYEEGDEDMKRTIAKAWSDARSGRQPTRSRGLPIAPPSLLSLSLSLSVSLCLSVSLSLSLSLCLSVSLSLSLYCC
ncbi:unnamed protein product [Spirodela intermedia]|uniref:Uncharacterized protein n=1 Tax=Spirodela intermedia TaxID=51605 RepID=A0A7I8J777_SPIIN|nr:unnamed protein product [Spirodela intermedia]CAA6665253.1 unnamed protein product [Spirodela intermedia]